VLVVLLASTVPVIVFLAMLPGMIAKRRNHHWAQAATVPEHVEPAHVIRKVLLRQVALLNYINPF
jgi:hypothetical protein